MRNNKTLSLLLAVSFSFAIFCTGCTGGNVADKDGKEISSEESGDENAEENLKQHSYGNLNTFTADTVDGGTFNQDDLSGKDLTVINFWSVTCGPCIEEMPALASLQKALPDNVQLLTVCLDGKWEQDVAKSILDEAQFGGKTLIGWDGDAVGVIQKIQYTPTTLFFDKNGNAVGEAMIGGQEDLQKVYVEAINSTLKGMGREEINIEGK